MIVAGGVVFAAAALTEQRPWFERISAPLDGTGLSRTTTRLTVGAGLLPATSGRDDTRNALITASNERPVVVERLADYSRSRDAERALRRVVARDRGPDALAPDGFFDVEVGCPRSCRPAAVGRHGSVLILLARVVSAETPRAGRGDRALTAMRRRYADQVGLDTGPGGELAGLVEALGIAGGVLLLFVPFAAWHAAVARRAPRTPHRHGADALPPSPALVDVCPEADEERNRGWRFLAAQVAIFCGCGTIAVLDQRLVLIVLAAAPLSWLLARGLNRRRPRVGATRRGVGLVTSGVLQTEVLALRGAALWLTALAWVLGSMIVFAVPSLVRDAILGSVTFGDQQGRDIVPFVLDMSALSVVLVAFLSWTAALGRFARRLRTLAADRDHRRRPRPEVLYLRAFTDDRRLVGAGDFIRRPATEVLSFRARVPFEEMVAQALDRHGRVVSITEPGTPLLYLPLGASHERLSDEEWQAAVRTHMRAAALVVIVAGTTPGLLWEVADATRQGLLDRVLLVFPPDGHDDELRTRWRESAATIAAAGGPELELPVDAATVLAVQIAETGPRRIVVADRRDQHTYAAAIAACSPQEA